MPGFAAFDRNRTSGSLMVGPFGFAWFGDRCAFRFGLFAGVTFERDRRPFQLLREHVVGHPEERRDEDEQQRCGDAHFLVRKEWNV